MYNLPDGKFAIIIANIIIHTWIINSALIIPFPFPSSSTHSLYEHLLLLGQLRTKFKVYCN